MCPCVAPDPAPRAHWHKDATLSAKSGSHSIRPIYGVLSASVFSLALYGSIHVVFISPFKFVTAAP